MSRYVKEKHAASRWDESAYKNVEFMSCAGCRGKGNAFLTQLDPVRGHPWPSIPVCQHCYVQYRALPNQGAANRFVFQLTQEMERRVRGK